MTPLGWPCLPLCPPPLLRPPPRPLLSPPACPLLHVPALLCHPASVSPAACCDSQLPVQFTEKTKQNVSPVSFRFCRQQPKPIKSHLKITKFCAGLFL